MSLELKRKQDREEAEKFMEAIGEPPAEVPEVTPPAPEATPDPQTPPPAPEVPQSDSPEITRLQAEIDRLRVLLEDADSQTYRSQALLFKSQRDTARDELRELKAAPPAPAAPTPAPRNVAEPDDADEDFTALVEEFGEKTAKAMWRLAQKNGKIDPAEVNRIVEEKTKPVADTLETVKQNQAVTAEERFFNNLATKVPDWQEINGSGKKAQDPKFTGFLLEKVPFQEYTFNDLLTHHYSQGNADKVAQIFETFKERVKPTEPPTPKPSLEQHLEPDKTNRGVTPPSDNTKPTYTRTEIEKFDREKRAGTLYGMTKDEIAAKSRLYQDAIHEGRVK